MCPNGPQILEEQQALLAEASLSRSQSPRGQPQDEDAWAVPEPPSQRSRAANPQRRHSARALSSSMAAHQQLPARCIHRPFHRHGHPCSAWRSVEALQVLCSTEALSRCMHLRRPEDTARIAAMAAHVEAIERALAARAAQLAAGRGASHHSLSAYKEAAGGEGRRVSRGRQQQQQPVASKQAQAAARVSVAMPGQECGADTRRTAPSTALQTFEQQGARAGPQARVGSPMANSREQHLPARGPALQRRSSHAERVDAGRAADAGSPLGAAQQWPAEEGQCCGKHCCAPQAGGAGLIAYGARQASLDSASCATSATCQPDAHAPALSWPSEQDRGDQSLSGACADREERRTNRAAPAAEPRPAFVDDEPQPRAQLPAPLRPRAAPASACQRSQSDGGAQMVTRDRRQCEPDGVVRHDSGLPAHRRLHARDGSRGSSEDGQPACERQPAAAGASHHDTRQDSAGDTGDTSNAALAAAQDAAQRSNARLEALTAQLADAQRTARADAEEADARLRQLAEELAQCATLSLSFPP